MWVDDSYIGNAEDFPEVVKNRTIAWQRLKDDKIKNAPNITYVEYICFIKYLIKYPLSIEYFS
jgi:hypothetical protein